MDPQQQTDQTRTTVPTADSIQTQQQDEVRVEELTLDKKLEILKKYNPYQYYEEGKYIDAQDTVNTWCLGQILQVDQKTLKIRFDGWSQKWEVWYKMNSYKVAPFRKNSRCYSGQTKIAIRYMKFDLDSLHEEKQRVEKLIENDLNGLGAFETTQYLRGQLYIYVDFLLGSNNYTEEQLDAVNDFLRTVLLLIVTWLRKVVKLMPLFAQVKVNPDLFLIDENIAILQSYPELTDLLRKLFCCCHRSMRYYLMFDKNQIQMDKQVTKDYTSKDFERQRKLEDDFDVDDIKEAIFFRKGFVFGQFINFINYFSYAGGFDAIIDVLRIGNEAEEKIPLEWITYLTTPFRNCNAVFSPSFSTNFVECVKDIIFNRIQNLSDKEVKELDKEIVGRLLNDIKDFLLIGLSDQETAQIIENNQLYIALRFLKSTYLEKRLKGLNDIKHMIDRIEQGLKQQLLNQQDSLRARITGQDMEMINVGNGSKLKPPKFINADILKNWLLEQKILDTVFGENTHLEIVKRGGTILKFLAKHNALPEQVIDLIWKCQLGKHEEMVRVVYNIIKDLVPFISLNYIDLFFIKIQSIPSQQYDEKYITFLKEFTLKAFDNYFQQKNEEQSMSEDHIDDFEETCAKRERKIISNIKEHLNDPFKGLVGDEKLYGLPIFWELIQDTATMTSSEIMELSMASLIEILKQQTVKHVRVSFLIRSIENLINGKSLVQSSTIIGNIISEFPEIEYQENVVTQRQVIQELNKQLQIIDFVIKNIEEYQKQVKLKVKQITENKKPLPEDVSNFIFVGRQSHDITLNRLLDFLEFLIVSGKEVYMGTDNIDKLWLNFVQQPNFNSDQTLFLKWINKTREEHQQEYSLFSSEEQKYFFIQILCNPTYVDFKKISIGQVKCFHKYFKVINKQEQSLEVQGRKLRVIKFKDLIGLDTLWRIAIESENDKVRDESMDLLVDLHLKFEKSISQEEQQSVWNIFIEQCMHNLEENDVNFVSNIITLLSKFLDRYEGKKTLKPEMRLAHHYSNIQPLSITVFNKTEQTRKQINVSYFQSIGFLRQKIAEVYNYQVNEFIMYIKSQYVDPEEEDDKYIKDTGLFQQVIIQKNAFYNPENHPKYKISTNQAYFDKLFYLLSIDQPKIIEPTWDLLSKLPINEKLQQEIRELEAVTEDQSNWSQILDPKSTYKLLYTLKIINNSFGDRRDPKAQQWKLKFITMGGVTHLLNTFISLDIKNIDTFLTIKCIELILLILNEFLIMDNKLVEELLTKKEQFVMKCLNLIDLTVEFTIQQEIKRGESYDEIFKRIQQTKQKKNKYKAYSTGNKNQQQDDQDDNDSQDVTLISNVVRQFQEEMGIVSTLFSVIMHYVIKNDESAVVLVTLYPNIEDLLIKGLLKTENNILRLEIHRKLKEIICLRSKQPEMKQMSKLLNIMLFQVFPLTDKYELRCQQYFEGIQQILESLCQADLMDMEGKITELIYTLSEKILIKQIKEKNTQDWDSLLSGYMKLLKVLLQRFPLLKQPIGDKILGYLLHQCLFEIPQGGVSKAQHQANPPKCKSQLSRQSTLKLIGVLCRDSPNNLMTVLSYMHKFNDNAQWRTNKDHDWNISLMDNEKSTTGYVGIKNLGCICYMISLFQQLFMIPSLRNDILSINDPDFDKVEKEENMLYQLQLLFAGLLKSEKQYVNPKGFCHAFKDWEGQPTSIVEQMDVEEFFSMFMDRLESAIKNTPQEKTVQYHFGGKFASEMICKGCPHYYERSEPFLSISVPVKNKKSLQEGLNAFISGDMLEGENAYFCEKCDKKVDVLKRTCVKKLPRNLIIPLKRFEFDYDKMIRVKINDYCEFPMELNMLDYTQEGLKRKEKLKKMKEERGEDFDEVAALEEEPLKYPKEYYEYKLTGIIVHTGTADSGHYYSFIQDREHPESGKWYEMNDHIVREFDPNEIPQECFGGEDTFQGYNMVQMKSMKWRNAYILIYERKTLDDVHSEEEESSALLQKNKEDVEMKSQLTILQEIEDKIAYENQKYWQNRFLFANEYHEFVYDVALNWNTHCLIPKQYLTKNNDFHIFNKQPIPKEYLTDDNILEPIDEKLPAVMHTDLLELSVFKFATQFYFTILQRAMNKNFIPVMVNLLKSYMNKNSQCSSWLLQEFSNFMILEENLLQCPSKEMRKFQTGLLYCAMLTVYNDEKDKLNLYWKNGCYTQETFSTLGNFILVLIRRLYDLKQFTAHYQQYFQAIARFSILGPEAREFLLRSRIVGRLMDFFFEEASPYKEDFRNMNDIQVQIKEKPDIGLPTFIDKKQISGFQEMIEKRRLKYMADQTPKYKYLIEIVSNCIRSCKFGEVRTPFQIDETNYVELKSQERDLFIPEYKFLKKFFVEARRVRSVNAICKAYCHFAWQEPDQILELLRTIDSGLNEHDFDEVRPFLMLIQYLLMYRHEKDEKMERILQSFLEVVKNNCIYYKFTETMIEYILKITTHNASVRQWFYDHKPVWSWLLKWLNEHKQPPNPIAQNTSIKLFKKRTNLNQLQQHNQMYKTDSMKSQVLFQYRFRRLQQMMNNQLSDLSNELDLDQVDMQDYKFTVKEIIDVYNRKQDKVTPYEIEVVLDEMLNVKNLQNSQYQNEGYSNNCWYGCDTDKLLPGGIYKNLERSKFIDVIQVQLEKKKMEAQQMQRMGGQGGSTNPQEQDDEMETDNMRQYQGSDNDNDNDDDESDDDYRQLYQ